MPRDTGRGTRSRDGSPDGFPAGFPGGSAQAGLSALRVMTVLPPREHFAEAEAGAIAILVHRMARAGETVVGRAPVNPPYADVPFLPVPRVFLPLRRQARYAAGVALSPFHNSEPTSAFQILYGVFCLEKTQ